MQLDEAPRKLRKMDTSNREARNAIASLLHRFPEWREDLARLTARASRGCNRDETEQILRRCDEIESDLMTARTELRIGLADAPQRVAGNSRVVDVERALENAENSLETIRGLLAPRLSS